EHVHDLAPVLAADQEARRALGDRLGRPGGVIALGERARGLARYFARCFAQDLARRRAALWRGAGGRLRRRMPRLLEGAPARVGPLELLQPGVARSRLGLQAVDRLLGGVQIRLELFRARDARAGLALQRARRLLLLRGVLLELFHTRLRGRESLGLGAALLLRGLECAGPVLRLAPRADPLFLQLAEPAPFRREGRLELRIARAHLGERLVVSSGLPRGGGRCGAHLRERLGELGALGLEPRELALLPRVDAALPDGDAWRRTRALAGGIELGVRRGGAVARQIGRHTSELQ